MNTSMRRKAGKLLAVAAVAGSAMAAVPSEAQAPNRPNVRFFSQPMTYPGRNSQNGNVTFFAQPYTYPSHNGQSGNVTFFAQPYSYPSHNGQSGNVTFFAQPYSYPGHSGQSGNVTYFGAQPSGTVPQPVVRQNVVPITNLVPVRRR